MGGSTVSTRPTRPSSRTNTPSRSSRQCSSPRRRWYARRNTPEGVAGWAEQGFVHVLATDPDLEALLERHYDMHEVGFA